ncbi:hypothetical protein MNV49_001151 [Pseudohyphozyma bogoriensis]|nr:hypothetical protein MNV49_001151 [Pseudohyphozyma bogoriensis]
MEVLLRMLEAACATDSWDVASGLDPEPSNERKQYLRRRYRNLKSYMLVCRDFYSTVMPRIWERAVLFGRQSPLTAFQTTLSSRSPIYPNPDHPRWHRFGCYVRTLDFSFIAPRVSSLTSSSNSIHINLSSVLSDCPRLERLYFGNGVQVATAQDWHTLYLNLTHPRMESLRGVFLPHQRPETAAFLDLLNDAPQLEELSCGSLCLQADLSLSLIEIFKMNHLLSSHKTGIQGAGLRDLSFGSQCDLPFTFLNAIPRACPNLRSFHLLAGASVQTTANIDIDTFISAFPSSLTAFSFLADASLMFNSSFDRILESQPSLEYLHIRADFISLDFFLRTLPGLLTFLSIDLAALSNDAAAGPNAAAAAAHHDDEPPSLAWHLQLAFSSRAAVVASNGVAKEFRRQGLGWTMGTQSGIRTQVLRRLNWLSEMRVLDGATS